MNAKILEVVKVDNEISAFIRVGEESIWMTGSHITECVTEAFLYFGYDMPESTDTWAIIDAFKAEVERKISEGFAGWGDVLEMIK